MRHPHNRLEPAAAASPFGHWTDWRESYNPFRGSWLRPLWWLDNVGHEHLHALWCGRWMPHRILLGWLCDYLDRRLWI